MTSIRKIKRRSVARDKGAIFLAMAEKLVGDVRDAANGSRISAGQIEALDSSLRIIKKIQERRKERERRLLTKYVTYMHGEFPVEQLLHTVEDYDHSVPLIAGKLGTLNGVTIVSGK